MAKHNGTSSGGKRPPNGSGLGKKPRPAKADGVKKPINYVKDDTPRMDRPRRVAPVMPQTNKRLGEFVVDRFGHDGRGVASLEGKTLFIDGALAGETVSARLVEEHPRFIEARVDQILVAAPERVEPPCVHFSLCGGCQLQYMAPEQQLKVKQDALLEQLQRWGGLSPARILPPVSSKTASYRHRARLGVWYEDDGSVTLGFRQKQSKILTPIAECLVLAPVLNQLIAPLHNWLTELRAQKPVTHIELVATAAGAAAIVRHIKKLAPADLESLALLAQQQACQVWLEPNGETGLTDLTGQACDPRLLYRQDAYGLELQFHPQDFTQVNPQVNQVMVQQALALLDLQPQQRVLDLFCGIGNFTLPLARHCAEVIGIEAVASMVARGRENAARLHIGNAKFIAANLADMTHTQLQRLCGQVDAILLDPPREGAKEIIANIQQLVSRKQLLVPRIVYVSCNPATLARDAKLLAAAGYELSAAGVLDMFPHTAHVESMALFLLK